MFTRAYAKSFTIDRLIYAFKVTRLRLFNPKVMLSNLAINDLLVTILEVYVFDYNS